MDDKDLDDAALWAVIDAAAAASAAKSRSRRPLAISDSGEGEVVHEPWSFRPPRKVARTSSSEMSPMGVGKSYSSPEIGRAESSGQHCLAGMFPSVSLFMDYQKAAMAILDKSDYTMISGNAFIKKTGWRKISFYFNLSYEIRDKSIEFDEQRNVQRAEFVVRAYMQGGRFSDGWGSCERREKRFLKPNHDIPSTAETRAKNRACQDLIGIGEYKPGASQLNR